MLDEGIKVSWIPAHVFDLLLWFISFSRENGTCICIYVYLSWPCVWITFITHGNPYIQSRQDIAYRTRKMHILHFSCNFPAWKKRLDHLMLFNIHTSFWMPGSHIHSWKNLTEVTDISYLPNLWELPNSITILVLLATL